ncbi:protein kinase [Echinococcus multilocularis]|uniref:Protein kinase n=1 Tax=Echinococcus multilocularis TaxID=6211 RepID=A0A068Y2T4_ECHMU|nr:protein kinase [Echinococcus multilocularis]
MTGIRIPTWRASSGRMMSDICHFCWKNQNTRNLVLLDPMALSPLSPLLNLTQHHPLPRPTLTGILWLTPLDSLSPFYRVPSEENGHERGEDGYPRPICLRFLAVAALLVNWVAWISRVESYAVLGSSPGSLASVADPPPSNHLPQTLPTPIPFPPLQAPPTAISVPFLRP